MNVDFPALAIAARRLGLDAGELGESVLHAIGCGWDEMEAVHMSIIEVLQRRGAYRGRLKQAIDDGTIFQIAEDGNGNGSVSGRIGEGRFRKAAAPLPAQNERTCPDDGEW